MSRVIPDVPKDWKPPQTGSGRSYEIELITPMVGGGATAGKVDPDFPIRPTAIRGHLRYWWRLVRGHSLGDGLWRREEEIFGSTEFPSPVTVIVSPGPKKPTLYTIGGIKPTSTHGYVLFPAIDKGHDLL
jgi:CRISPR-associated protein Cmr1